MSAGRGIWSPADVLVVHAAPLEAPGIAGQRTVELGVGKVAAATNLYAALIGGELAGQRIDAVLLVGIAGAYPERHRGTPPPVRPGELCVVGGDVLADEGVRTERGFVDFGAPAFGHDRSLVDAGPFPASPRLSQFAAARLGVPIVRGATVSTCSGSEATSRELYERTHADVESMEGAAVAAVCRRREVPLLHVRAISNWTGDRERAEWDIGRAVEALRAGVARLT
ncbi:MAG: futalosine hydrolase [Planctomycetes bacterium]|nr:futalosine hydrolase [Planctomycetota bacterium]